MAEDRGQRTEDTRANRQTGQPANGPTGQRANRQTGKPANRPTGQPANGPTGQPANRPTGKRALFCCAFISREGDVVRSCDIRDARMHSDVPVRTNVHVAAEFDRNIEKQVENSAKEDIQWVTGDRSRRPVNRIGGTDHPIAQFSAHPISQDDFGSLRMLCFPRGV